MQHEFNGILEIPQKPERVRWHLALCPRHTSIAKVSGCRNGGTPWGRDVALVCSLVHLPSLTAVSAKLPAKQCQKGATSAQYQSQVGLLL
eukprot:3823445-Amphidinium_carterae.1